MSIELVMPSNHLILCRPLLLLPSIFPSIVVFSNESALRIRWPKYWSFSFNIRSILGHKFGWVNATLFWLSFRNHTVHYCCCSVTKSCLTLCDPIDCSMSGSSVSIISQSLLKLMSVEFSFCLQSFPALGSFPVNWLFALCGQSIGASLSALVLPMNTQGWFSLGLTSLISLLSKWLSKVFFSTTIWKH